MYIVINGGGKIGSYLAGMLLDNGHDVAVIEQNAETAGRLARDLPGSILVIEGDGCDAETQNDAGAQMADIFVATTGRDDDNLVSCELAKVLAGVPRCIARVNNPRNERIFRRMGIESVSSTTVISRLIEEEAMAGTIKAIANLHNNDICMIQMKVPHSDDFGDRGILVEDIDLPAGSLVAAVDRHDGELDVVSPLTRVFAGDELILLSDVSVADEVRDFIRSL